MYKRYSDKLFCFSPPVMIATFGIEIIFAIYTIWRYKLDRVSRLVVALLVLLATFQFIEYNICRGASIEWARYGFVAITLLPPLGIHLASTLASKSNKLLLTLAYGSAAVFAGFFLWSSAITNQVCGGNYIIFDMHPSVGFFYGVYYYGWLFVGTLISLLWSKEVKKKGIKRALQALMAGYLLLLFPTTTANLLEPGTIAAIPSVMCGFAILLAFVLVFWIMPPAGQKRSR